MAERAALLIGCGTFEDQELARLRSPAADLLALSETLADPVIGQFALDMLSDEPQGRVMRAAERFFARRGLDDTLLCYISTHGIKDEHGRLYFAMADTESDLLASTAVAARHLQDLMDHCRARSIILVLDCCYSGAFVEGVKGEQSVPVQESLAGRGRAILTATNAIEYAWEGGRVTGDGTPSIFTAAVVEGLRTGAADRDRDGRVSVDDLAGYTYERVRSLGSTQTPMRWMSGVADSVYIARVPPSAADPGSASSSARSLVTQLVRLRPAERAAAVEILLNRRTETAAEIVRRLAGDPNDRLAGATALVEVGVGGVPEFGAFIRAAPASTITDVCVTFATVGADAVPALAAMLDLVDGPARTAITDALVRIGTMAALFELAERSIAIR